MATTDLTPEQIELLKTDTPEGIIRRAHWLLDALVAKGWTPTEFVTKLDVAHASDGKLYEGDKHVVITFMRPMDEVSH